MEKVTERDREAARRVKWHDDAPDVATGGVMEKLIAAEVAQARAEGYRAGVEAAAAHVERDGISGAALAAAIRSLVPQEDRDV